MMFSVAGVKDGNYAYIYSFKIQQTVLNFMTIQIGFIFIHNPMMT